MAFDNYYPNRKDHRRPYYRSRAFDRTCRNHGTCGWCQRNRKHADRRRAAAHLDDLLDYEALLHGVPSIIDQQATDVADLA